MAQAKGEDAPKVQFDDINAVTSGSSSGYNVKNAFSEKLSTVDDVEVWQDIANQDRNHQKKQKFSGWLLVWLAYQSTGVIYGDIGTSPLYVYSSTFASQPSYDDLVGALSIIIWSLTLIVTVKYCFIVLRADDDGEGGTFALYSLLARYAHIARRDPTISGTLIMRRHDTGDMKPAAKSVRSFIERSMFVKVLLQVIGVLGVSMIMADGVLTPAQSVLGAIQGLNVVAPNITSPVIVGVSCAILILLFLIQPLGTSKIGSSFAPIVIVWLLFNFCSGSYNLALYDHSVLKAFSPYFAGEYLVRNGEDGWRSLGGLLLAFTGVEALFADLGAFSERAIQISWLGFGYPCLLLAYIGQAAFISADQTGLAVLNPFFYTVPPGTLYFSLVIAILAAIVASQAMITSTFQLLIQIMNLSYFPHIKAVHKSKTFHGQIYIPLANWLLLIGTIIVTAVYSNTTSLGNAYGVCVIIVTFITTCMVSLVALVVWRVPVYIVLPLFLVFGALDATYMSSALTKIPSGAWFTLMLAVLLSSMCILWRGGKERQWAAEARDHISFSNLLVSNADGDSFFTPGLGGAKISIVDGLGIFFDKVGSDKVPLVFQQFLRKFCARPKVSIFLHLRPLSKPTVDESERYVLGRTSLPYCYRMTIRHGYADGVINPDLARITKDQLILHVTRRSPSTVADSSSISSKQHSPEIQQELDVIEQAFEGQMTYIVGKEQMKIRAGSGLPRRLFLGLFLWIRELTRTKMASLDLPIDNLVEVGYLKEI